MSKWIRENGLCIIYVLGFILVLGVAVLEIWSLITYGNKPADEIPGWIWWLWFGGGRK